ncbi:Xanthine phosphoribosyltransferase 1 [Entomortierella chlamydospora]|uniref:Xanthine phosphoribosyltransferase 1 n=1 Tax=Entomortierella chlamydospora TaxID=101097 RepID=A0A9P6N1U7_9FUNG|nr:Xanthine phosphoribosyltransferase 1 [Entomortierella chlamydospora]
MNFSFLFTVTPVEEAELPIREISQIVRSTRHLFTSPPAWTDEWLHSQKIDPNLNATEGEDLTIDIVYTWVNGSDPKLQEIKEVYQDASPFFQAYRSTRGGYRAGGFPHRVTSQSGDQTANRFRDMNELKYSVRSVSQYAYRMLGKIHILTSRVDTETNESQVPSWLDLEKSKDIVELVPHDKIFEDPSFLPSFNSLSIESQIHNIPNLTDAFVYLNDDVFLGTTMLPADVWTPLYGFVFHMEPSLLVPPTILDLPKGTLNIGEWNSLQYSNHLLSGQFGPRYRSYIAHVPHVLSVPLLKEIEAIWPEAFSQTSSHRFRGEGQARDIQVSFFMAHYVIERQRETQLSSYWFHRLDSNQDGVLDWSEREQLIQKIEQWNNNPYPSGFKSYIDNNNNHLRQLGFPPSGSSTYKLSGLDGFPLMIQNSNTSATVQGIPLKPYAVSEEFRTCKLDIDFCFSSAFRDKTVEKLDVTSTGDIYQRMAFSEFHCGDCLLHILRRSSTEPGLGSEILPLDKKSDAYKTITNDLAKYNYVIALSPYSFVQLQDTYGSQRSLAQILSKKDTEAFFCINDNIIENPRTVNTVQQLFSRFLNERFPIPSPWEKK